ncbi:MAG TPA: TonB-dependent receptor [Puia sp.]|jgi:outer membrane receptor for ferrienterochelin and colicin|nr:TonB-dependent receptor [Puia sp.]
MKKNQFVFNKFFVPKARICLLVLMIASGSVRSQTDTSNLEALSLKDLLNIKITTASMTNQELDKAPATVIVITEEQIKMRGYTSLLDVLKDLPDMKVDDKLYALSLNNFTMRGVPGQDKFILLLDGVRISSPTNEAMPIFENYPVNLAQQIEVVYGPASALYGADAVSGVINIITKKNASGKSILIDASTAIGMYGQTNNALFIAKKLGDHANLIVSGQYFYDQQPDYTKLYAKQDSLFSPASLKSGTFNTIYGPMTPNTTVNPNYGAPMSAFNVFAALHLDDFSIAVFCNYARTPLSFSDNANNNVFNNNVYAGQHINMANASYKKSFANITSTSTLMSSAYLLDPKTNSRTSYSNMEPSYLYSSGAMIKLEEQVDWKIDEKLNFTGGAGFSSYYSVPSAGGLEEPVDKNSYTSGEYQGTETINRPEGLPALFNILRYNNIGTYFQTQYAPADKLNFTLGARYDVNSRYGNTLNPRLGVVYKPFSQTTIKALYGSAFLAPSPIDTYENFGSFDTPDSGRTYHSNFMHLPNPGLKPITSHNLELSIRQYATDNFSITLDGYYTLLTNLHTIADDNKSTHLYNNSFAGATVDYVEVTVNEGKQKSYGGSLQLNYKNSIGSAKLNSYASLSYTGGTVNSTAGQLAQLEYISPFIIHIGTDLKAGKFTFSPRLTILGKQHLTGFSDTTSAIMRRQTIAGYALLNLSLRYSLAKKYSIFVNIHNALNQNYRSVGEDMDLTKKTTEIFYGQHEDPISVMAGFSFNIR